jgi:hypothetical protein
VLKCLKLSAGIDVVQILIYTKDSVLQNFDVESHSRKLESFITLAKLMPFGELKNITDTKSSGNVYFLYGTLMKPVF